MSWPPRSPDSNPIDSYFCGSTKNVNIGDTRPQIWQRIQDAINEAPDTTEALESVRTSFRHRADTCVRAHGGHFQHLL